jgi:hypothetical protein
MPRAGTHRYNACGAWTPIARGSLSRSADALAINSVIATLDRLLKPAKLSPSQRRQRVMRKAWALNRESPEFAFAECLTFAWKWAV